MMNKKSIFSNISENKFIFIIGGLFILLLILLLSVFSLIDTSTDTSIETGGSGEPISQTIIIESWNDKDNYDNTIGEQLLLFEQEFIKGQLLGDVLKNKPTTETFINLKVQQPIIRTVDTSNTLTFKLSGMGLTYKIVLDYDNDRLIKITNETTGLIIERYLGDEKDLNS